LAVRHIGNVCTAFVFAYVRTLLACAAVT
jgi:hypothetical protein